ncbi:hypothetical protein pb186bvf_015631 [Paramecium bursaria]
MIKYQFILQIMSNNDEKKNLLPQLIMNQSNLLHLKQISAMLQKQILILKKSIYYVEPYDEKINVQTDSQNVHESNSQYGWLMKNKEEYGKSVIQKNQEYMFCAVCHKYFPDEQAVLQHKERAHFGKSEVLQCNFCFSYFNGELSLLNHKFQYHQSKRKEMKIQLKQKIREEQQKAIYDEVK